MHWTAKYVTARSAVGGNQPSGPHTSADTRADLIQFVDHFPPDRRNSGRLTAAPLFIPAHSPPFKRGNVSQALFDVGFIAFVIFFICAFAIGTSIAVFILLFVR